jgi:ABC-type nitrate/sulfonate/bicarbonate transport system substrate-binding protein
MRRAASLAAAALAFASLAAAPAYAGDKVTVGKGQDFAWTFTPVDIGIETGLWKKYGFDEVKIVAFAGDAKVQQAMIAGDIDFAVAGGPGMAFSAKGASSKAVAAFAGAPRNLSVAVGYDSKIASVAELRGKKLAVSTAGSLSDWLGKRLAVVEGWGEGGVTTVAMGGLQPRMAAIKTGQIDGMVMATEVVYTLEDKKELKPLLNFGDVVKDFITHVIFARDDVIAKNPDEVRRFVNGFFAILDWMRAHKAETSAITARLLKSKPEIMVRVFEEEMPMMSKDGTFDPKAVDFMANSFVEMGEIDKKPEPAAMLTTRFVPARVQR